MRSLTVFPRLLRVASVLLAWRLDEIVETAHLFRPLKLVRPFFGTPRPDVGTLSRGARLRGAMTELGPIFVKAGQVLSTRRDLIPADIADELALLQDQVPPFPGAEARAIVERELKQSVTTLFARFDETALASASIAQVHAATLRDGREVVVKVLRPGIAKRIANDVALLRSLGELVNRWHPNADKIRPLEVVAEVEKMLENELDLQREGASASLLRRNFASGVDMYVPAVEWDYTTDGVLTLERVYGVSCDDVAAIDAAGIDRKALAVKGVRVFYEQVFRDNFFHADAHPGNVWWIWRARTTRASSRWISASWVRCPKPTSTGWRRTSSRCSSATTSASPSCTSTRAGCRRICAWTSWLPPCARCASRTSPARCRRSRWQSWW